jgi:thiol-disulfide isomerase/thioredoxin
MFAASTGSTSEERLQKRKKNIIHFIDSIFKYFPGSMALPNIIRLSHDYLGDDTTAFYQSLLSIEQKSSPYNKQLDNYFNRKEKIKKEKLFEDFEMRTNEDKNFRLSSIRGKKLILIDFWASDCFPCKARHKELVELYEQYSAKGLEIVSVSLDDNKTEWLQAIKTDNMKWINVSDLKGWDTPLAVSYFVELIPYALWVDRDRKIIGPDLDEKQIVEYLE